jgi:hypothetical protein
MKPLVIALGEKNKRSEDELSFIPGEVFESIPAPNARTGNTCRGLGARKTQTQQVEGRTGVLNNHETYF